MAEKKTKPKEKSPEFADAIIEQAVPRLTGHEVTLSIIIPVFNSSMLIGQTIDSIASQDYPRTEVIVVDAGSTDKTLEIVGSYGPLITRIYSVTDYNRYDMINRGLSLASGRYVTVLFPGCLYVSESAFKVVSHAILVHNYPELIYFGTIQRQMKRLSKIVQGPMERATLSRGITPATFPASWFRADVFETLGKFRTDLPARSSYEYYCRFACQTGFKAVSLDRVFVDYDEGAFSYTKVMRYAGDTWRVLLAHFGFFKAFVWFLGVNHMTMLKSLFQSLNQRLFGK